ncbi:DHH family phosphoesterase [Desulfovibrio sp. OttesenSCG-928-A18]|nr:DHH family phosphoesterase [Desulfovibrio sp. OttesenSCG-928-A18]
MHQAMLSVEKALRQAKKVLLATHINPDGDAVGSMFALARIAVRLGVEARVLLPAPLPDFLSWLTPPCPCVRDLAALDGWVPDLVLLADCGDAKRAGQELDAFFAGSKYPAQGWEQARTLNVDHHKSNPHYADVNWVEHTRSATGELVGTLAEHLGFGLGGELGEAVYLALASDTGNFTYSNTSASCLAMASRIVDAGLDIARFTQCYENVWTLARMHLWGRLLSEVSLHAGGAIACSIVPKRYLDEFALRKSDLEGFASWLRKIKGVRVGLFIREDAPNFCKISLRSMGDVDVQAVTVLHGGGGHASAAGAELNMAPEKAAEILVAQIAACL